MTQLDETTTKHHDGFGLAESIVVKMGPKDVNAGNGRHVFSAEVNGEQVMFAQFQHGPRLVEGSKAGILDSVLLAVLIERYEAFQSGRFSCSENDAVLAHLRQALSLMHARAKERASRSVLGLNEK
jgi:hypothetical protein